MNSSQRKSNNAEEFTFSITPDGKIKAIYDDRIADFLLSGTTTIKRASHVEPNPDGEGWVADMSPSGGPILGPCILRSQALELERDWLKAKMF